MHRACKSGSAGLSLQTVCAVIMQQVLIVQVVGGNCAFYFDFFGWVFPQIDIRKCCCMLVDHIQLQCSSQLLPEGTRIRVMTFETSFFLHFIIVPNSVLNSV